ncbi:MAG TPA: HAD-IA family hydrolase [Clostridia bacterium]|nr:HAD-IA family hydrolase [Clostridia bacterium]
MIRVLRSIPAEHLKLLIFDLDGTLVDSQLDLAHAVNAMLRKFDRAELPVDVIATYIGDGAPMLIRRALGDPQDERFVKDALHYFMAYYREHKLDNTQAYAGIPEALSELRDRSNGRFRMAVLTNKPVNPSRGIIEGLGMNDFFLQIYGGNSFSTKKPDPFGARVLLQETGAAPEETLMIGDSQVDVLTARNAGMWSLGVTYGFAPESLQKHPPDVLIDSPSELTSAIGMGAVSREGEIPAREGFTE